MNLLVAAVVFIAGVLVGIRLFAGLYSALDLWYTLRTAWPVVLRRTVGWTAVCVVVLLFLPVAWRWVFVAGMAAHLLVYVAATFTITHTGARKPRPTPIVE